MDIPQKPPVEEPEASHVVTGNGLLTKAAKRKQDITEHPEKKNYKVVDI